jgi:Tol biopolymer transport system component
MKDATFMNWSPAGHAAYVSERALWLTQPVSGQPKMIVPADPAADSSITRPRFSQDSLFLVFVKSTLGGRGEIWLVDLEGAEHRALTGDRVSENAVDAAWLENGSEIVYLTNRSGTYGLWVFNIPNNTIQPLTSTLLEFPVEPVGIALRGDRVIVPRHIADSDIVRSDGHVIAGTDNLEFQPAVSPDGKQVAWTVLNPKGFEVWTSGPDGQNARFHALGSEPRFSPNGVHLVYTHTSIVGEVELRRIDLRDGSSDSLTDSEEVDFQADWSPDGRSIAFASGRSSMALWLLPASGGKRRLLSSSGYYPRFSADARSVTFWDREAFWTVSVDGGPAQRLRDAGAVPIPGVPRKDAVLDYLSPSVHGGRRIWPAFDTMPDGRFVIAPIDIAETALWSVDILYAAETE